jgi:hypothetical protein
MNTISQKLSLGSQTEKDYHRFLLTFKLLNIWNPFPARLRKNFAP